MEANLHLGSSFLMIPDEKQAQCNVLGLAFSSRTPIGQLSQKTWTMTFLGLFQLQTGAHGRETAWAVGCRVCVPANCQGNATTILLATLATVPPSSFHGSDSLSASPTSIRTPTMASGPGLGYTATRTGVLRHEMTPDMFSRAAVPRASCFKDCTVHTL